jgi:hypothetical protein
MPWRETGFPTFWIITLYKISRLAFYWANLYCIRALSAGNFMQCALHTGGRLLRQSLQTYHSINVICTYLFQVAVDMFQVLCKHYVSFLSTRQIYPHFGHRVCDKSARCLNTPVSSSSRWWNFFIICYNPFSRDDIQCTLTRSKYFCKYYVSFFKYTSNSSRFRSS